MVNWDVNGDWQFKQSAGRTLLQGKFVTRSCDTPNRCVMELNASRYALRAGTSGGTVGANLRAVPS